jgi:hypothetical protein
MFIDDAEPVLIFKAKMISDYQEDSIRDFMVRYYLNDKTIAVFEGKSTKSGFQGGRFLARMKVKDPHTQQNYDDGPFAVGNKVQLAGRYFDLIDAPEYTFCLMEANPLRFPLADMQYSIQKLGAYLTTKSVDLTAAFAEKDPTQSGILTVDAADILYSFAPAFPKHCAITIVRRFGDEDIFDSEQLFAYLTF